MVDFNKAFVEGALYGDVECRVTAKGLDVITFAIMTQGGYFDKNSKWIDRDPERVEVTMFGERNKRIMQQYGHGARLRIEGRIGGKEFKDKVYLNLIAENVVPIGDFAPDPKPRKKQEVVEPESPEKEDLPF